MGMQRMFNVTCDGPDCYEMYDGSSWYESEAIILAKEDGWKISGTLAICPTCQGMGVTFAEIRAWNKQHGL